MAYFLFGLSIGGFIGFIFFAILHLGKEDK